MHGIIFVIEFTCVIFTCLNFAAPLDLSSTVPTLSQQSSGPNGLITVSWTTPFINSQIVTNYFFLIKRLLWLNGAPYGDWTEAVPVWKKSTGNTEYTVLVSQFLQNTIYSVRIEPYRTLAGIEEVGLPSQSILYTVQCANGWYIC